MTNNDFKVTEYNEPLILQRADPYVYKHTDGYYYFTASVPAYDRIILRRATTIQGLAEAKEVTIWLKHEEGEMSRNIWAPELHFIKGAWYIYFAGAKMDDMWRIRPYVLECKDECPMTGEWTELGMMQPAEEDEFSFKSFSLDATVFEHRGEYYYIWAEKVGVGKMISNLYIAKLETPWRLKTVQVLLTTPDYDWERVKYWVDEGPAILKHDNKIFMAFSASSTGADYCIGLMYIEDDKDLLDPRQWKKLRYPVLQTDVEKGIYGPGHNSFTKSEDGTKDIMVFHYRQYDEIVGDSLYDPNRHTTYLVVKWNEEGMPVFELNKLNWGK